MKFPSGFSVSRPHYEKQEDGTVKLMVTVHVKWWYRPYALVAIMIKERELGWKRFLTIPSCVIMGLLGWPKDPSYTPEEMEADQLFLGGGF